MKQLLAEPWQQFSSTTFGRTNRFGKGIASVIKNDYIVAEIWLFFSQEHVRVYGPFLSCEEAKRAIDQVLSASGWNLK